MYEKYVVAPTASTIARDSKDFNIAGLHGAFCSMDGVHVVTERIPFKLRNNHLAYKTKLTARSYNVVVNHRRRILSTTTGHPARFNDKSLVMFDVVARKAKDGKFNDVTKFELYRRLEDGRIVKQLFRGCWMVVDNGYHNWSTTVPPIKNAVTVKQIRWSQWIESMRKDVECTFGILKGRWRIIKAGIRVHGEYAADSVWITCCSLHNFLLEVDGIDSEWNSDYLGEMGNLDMEEEQCQQENFALMRLRKSTNYRNFDISGMGRGNDVIRNNEEEENLLEEPIVDKEREQELLGDVEKTVNVTDLSLETFRSLLVEHFDILYHKKQIHWPSKRKNAPTIYERR